MWGKGVKKVKKCKTCYSALSDENRRIGVCVDCAEKEAKKIKRRIIISSIAGLIFIVLAFSAIYYMRTNAYTSVDGSAVYIPIFMYGLTFNVQSFIALVTFSLPELIITVLILFLLPFGSFVKWDFFSPRHEAENNIQNFEPQTAKSISEQGSNKLDDVGMFIFSFFILIISGPFFFVYRLYKLRQVSNYVKKLANERI